MSGRRTDGKAEDIDRLVSGFQRTQLARNGVPDDATRADRHRCLDLLRETLPDCLDDDALTVSPLGIGWTEVFEVRTRRPIDASRLLAAGWYPLDALLGGDRRPSGVNRRWAVVHDGRVLGGVRFVDTPSDPVSSVLAGCRERSEVRLRDVLELRALSLAGASFPAASPVLTAAAAVESGLGGRSLAAWATGRTEMPPVRLGTRRRFVVAISGVDGSGKSTLRAALAESLDRAGLPVSTVWVRPGMGLGPLAAIAMRLKRLLRQDTAPGVRAMADPAATRPTSRRGAIGYVWSLLVSISFLVGVWRQHRAAHGVVLYDRHLVDALATLDFAYEGVDLRLQRSLVRALLPRADVRLYLDVGVDVSVSRKPDDVLGEHAVSRQLAAYDHWLDRTPPYEHLDATRSKGDLEREAILRIVTIANTRRHNRRIYS